MVVDRKWVERNLGFDPIAKPPPPTTFAFSPAVKAANIEDFQREIIDFDSESPAGLQFLAFSTATGLSRYTDVPWPKKLAPITGSKPAGGGDGPLPRADVLVVTWTVDEGHALSRVLTPGKDSRNDYLSYTHNFETISQKMRKDCPALVAKRLGAHWTTSIGGKSVVVFKSDSHMSQDGPQLPNIDVWRQIVGEVQPKLTITTGTAGGIGKQFEVGDVIVSPIVRFDCISKFKKEPFAQNHYASSPLRRRISPPPRVCSRPTPRNCRRIISALRRLSGSRRRLLHPLSSQPISSASTLRTTITSSRAWGTSRRWAMPCLDWSLLKWALQRRDGWRSAMSPIRRSRPMA
jgi:hypothetical protein